MAIIILSQPTENSLNAAYRPILFKVSTATLIPIVFCDIYFNGVYYKTQSVTTPKIEVLFDIQDAAQEFLTKFLPPNGVGTLVLSQGTLVTCSCKFRGSSIVDNLIVPEATVPIQGTGDVAPVAGTGVESVSLYILNSTLQQEDNQDLATHLDFFRSGTWSSDAYPLTHRNTKYRVESNDYFPFVYLGDAAISCVRINYKKKDGTTGTASSCSAFPSCVGLTGFSVDSTNLGDGTQRFVFFWNPVDSLVTGVIIQYRISGSSDPYVDSPGSIDPFSRFIILPLGLYEFRFVTVGSCNATTSSVVSGQGIEPPACVPVVITGPFALSDPAPSFPYSFDINFTGSLPASLSAITAPGWMTITVVGNTVQLRGTPSLSDIDTGVEVSFDLTNACGTDNFFDTIDIQVFARTLTFAAAFHAGSYSYVQGFLNSSINVDLNLVQIFADGKSSGDCSGSVVATVQAHNRVIPAGGTSNGASESPTGDWSLVNSFHIHDVSISIPGQFTGAVVNGQVIHLAGYDITIIFNGC